MADEKKTVVITQEANEKLALDHSGGVALFGSKEQPAINARHHGEGHIVHSTAPQKPLVHMVCWDSDDACRLDVSGRVVLAGDEKAPIGVMMAHRFSNPHEQTHKVDPLDHTLRVSTTLAQPIHHALQMRTPLQVRFCNPWHVASDYTVDVKIGDRSLFSIRLTGATVAKPQPCPEDPCPPVVTTYPELP